MTLPIRFEGRETSPTRFVYPEVKDFEAGDTSAWSVTLPYPRVAQAK